MEYSDDKGVFIFRMTRRTKSGSLIRAKGKPFKIYIRRY